MSMELFRPLASIVIMSYKFMDIEKNLPIYLKIRFLDVQRFRNAKLKDMSLHVSRHVHGDLDGYLQYATASYSFQKHGCQRNINIKSALHNFIWQKADT